ncbi:MAG: endonuclease/exonuclease/phosphatase family protein [Halobacteriovoraceae bacterium]|nr:endonuclease/exonuclease/phosphatase family protein [Halobacteriovoraceae bacterium]
MRYILLIALIFSSVADAKRYIIPNDKDVLTAHNTHAETDSLYPFEIDVLVWNIYKGYNKTWKKDFEDLTRDKEILLLQEVYAQDKMFNVFERMVEFEFWFARSWIDTKDNNTASGVSTASIVKTTLKKWQRSYYREPIIKTPKVTLFTRYKLTGHDKELLVGNIHAINFVRYYKLKHMLVEAAKVIKNHQGPVLFAGDFNTWTKTKLGVMNGIFKNLAMKRVKFDHDIRKRFLGKVLDHAWIKELKVISSRIPNVKGSDHPPLELRLSLL